jgi:integrase
MGRRAHGEGTIVQRKDGRWHAAYYFEQPDGHQDRKYLYGATQREVVKKLEAFKRELAKGAPLPNDRITVDQFLTQWLEEVVRPKNRPKTFESYAMHVRLYLGPAIGHHRLVKLTPQHVQALMNRQLADGLSPRTVNYTRSILRAALNRALKWGLVSRNVATLVDAPPSRRPEVRPLSFDQARSLLKNLEGHRLEALFSVALAVGLRQGEALALHWADVDLDQGLIHVRHTLQKIDNQWQFLEPKTERSRRTIPLPAVAAETLRRHKERQDLERLAAGSVWEEWDLVFPSTRGTPLDGSNVTHTLQRILADSGLPRQRFHDLRHFCASLLVAQGVPMRVIMEILGHSQITLTMDTYSHVALDQKTAAAQQIDAVLHQ